jgi:transcriptional regulator of acetoin/glycerol metabolism
LQQILGDAPVPVSDDAATPIWLKVPRHLFLKQTDEALRLARLEAGRLMSSIFGSGFDSYNLVRAELSAGKWEGARHLLGLRAARGNRHYLDDFFEARIELAAHNAKTAAAHFAKVLKAVDYYRAKARLDIELRLSCELSQGDIVQLTSAAQKIIERTRAPTTEAGAPATPPHLPGVDTSGRELPIPHRHGIDLIVGRSSSTLDIRQTVIQFANLDAPVLITGETGTGKELVARALHDMSNRKIHPFIAVDCGSITETLLESELFGHERGSFTGADRTTKGIFEEAGQGTAFLDEIGDISPRLQAALLRVI